MSFVMFADWPRKLLSSYTTMPVRSSVGALGSFIWQPGHSTAASVKATTVRHCDATFFRDRHRYVNQ